MNIIQRKSLIISKHSINRCGFFAVVVIGNFHFVFPGQALACSGKLVFIQDLMPLSVQIL